MKSYIKIIIDRFIKIVAIYVNKIFVLFFLYLHRNKKKLAVKMNLSSVASKITCPLYIVGGALDRVIPPDHAQKLARSASGDVTLNMVSDGSHVVNNRPYKYRSQSADWMAKKLNS